MQLLTAIILMCQMTPNNHLAAKNWERQCIKEMLFCMGKDETTEKFNQCLSQMVMMDAKSN